MHTISLVRFGKLILATSVLTLTHTAVAADLTVTAFGGSWEEAYRACFVQPFEKRTGKTVDVILGSPTQWINQVSASPENPPIDVIVGSVEGGKIARERGLIDAIDESTVPNIRELNTTLLEYGAGYGFPITFGDFGLMYNTELVDEPPASWKEFIDGTIDGKWQVGMSGISYPATLSGVVALFSMIYTDTMDDVQTALDIVKNMRDSGNVTFYNDPNTPLAAVRQGDLDMAMYFDGRAWAEHDAGADMIGYVSPAPGSVAFPNMAQKVKNGSDLGYEFLNELASVGGQTCFSNAMLYAGSNENIVYDPKVKPRVATAETSVWVPFEDIADHAPEWIEMWNKQIGR